MDPFNIYVWSLRTGQLMDILNGHTSSISSLVFSQTGAMLISGSWDKTVRVWDIFEKKGAVDSLTHASEVLSVDFHPNGKDIVATTLGGQIYMWQAADATLLGIIDCKDDISGGRLREERFSAKNSSRNKHFNSIAISPNGEFVIGGGNSKHICLYDMRYKLLMRRFAVTQNRSLDGVLHLLNSKQVKDGMAEHELDIDSDLEEDAW
jgi:periodic tryptophan protein 2